MKSCAVKDMCTLEEFAQFVSPLIPEDIQQECYNTNPASQAQYYSLCEFSIPVLHCIQYMSYGWVWSVVARGWS